jgi:general secretion pathway protein K
LIAVLGFLTVMSLLTISVIGAARSSMSAATRHLARVQAQAAVDSAVLVAVQQLVAARGVRPAIFDGPQEIATGKFKVTVSARPESAKIDLNFADEGLLMGMFREAGVDADRAGVFASAVEDWRDADDLLHLNGAELREYEAAGLKYGPSNKLFENVGELRYVLGVTETVFNCLRPDVTVFAQRSGVDLENASPLVRRAAGAASDDPAKPATAPQSVVSGQSISAGEVFEVVARLVEASRRISRAQRVVVRITGNPREPYWILSSEPADQALDSAQRSCPSPVASVSVH